MAVCIGDVPKKKQYPAIPDGWLDYNCFGKPIKGTRIIATKTPLKEAFNNGMSKKDCPPVVSDEKYAAGVPLEDEFTPTQCMELVKTKFKGDNLELGAVVDLTFTKRYYNPQEFEAAGVEHHKIKCPGREIPSDEIYVEFSTVVNGLLARIGPKHLLAVHCTHGLNRTGYLVCRYLIQQQRFDVETAIKEFNTARGYDIERGNYLQDLRDGCNKRDGCSSGKLHPTKLERPAPYSVHPHDRRLSGYQPYNFGEYQYKHHDSWHIGRRNEHPKHCRSYFDNYHSLSSHPNHYEFHHGNYCNSTFYDDHEAYHKEYPSQESHQPRRYTGLHDAGPSWDQQSSWDCHSSQEDYGNCGTYQGCRNRPGHFHSRTWRPRR